MVNPDRRTRTISPGGKKGLAKTGKVGSTIVARRGQSSVDVIRKTREDWDHIILGRLGFKWYLDSELRGRLQYNLALTLTS